MVRGPAVETPYAFKKILARLHQCSNDHASCQDFGPSQLPRRVIDVGDCNAEPKLLESGGRIARYTALSYIWGMESQPVMTTIENVAQFTVRLPVSSLAQTIKDAIIVTRNIGVRYLWADSLCIIQDSDTDKDMQISRIPQIFRSALLTICAAHADSCMQGFLLHSHDSYTSLRHYRGFRDLAIPYALSNRLIGTVILQPHPVTDYAPDDAPISTRAWTMEERLLSQRVLIYADGVIMWQCRAGLFQVPGSRLPVDMSVHDYKRGNYMILDEELFSPHLSSSSDITPARLEILMEVWLHILTAYSQREISRPEDRLRALGGLASRFQYVLHCHQYVGGLWYSQSEASDAFFASQLLWLGCRNDYVGPLAMADITAPSWSWASVAGGVTFGTGATSFPSAVPEYWTGSRVCSVLQCEAPLVSSANLFGAVHDGRLTIRCPCRLASGPRRVTPARNAPVYLSPISRANDERQRSVPAFTMQLDRRPLTEPEQTSLVYARIVENRGLLLSPAADGTFRRVGIFWDWSLDLAESASFFEASTLRTITIL